MKPRVSVVTTVYNGESYFDRAIPGILAQTFGEFEFILVDDGSTDQSLRKLREVAARDQRVRVFAPGRLGASVAYNYAIAQATGELIARQDFDDRSYPERLRQQIAFLDANPDVGVVGSYCVQVDETRNKRFVRIAPTRHGDILTAMARYIPMPHTLATFRRRAWSEAGGYPQVDNLIDLRFWLRVARLGWRFANIPEVLGEHYVHSGSWFDRSFSYAYRQRDLARVQAEAVRQLGLPRWMYVYALGRYAYTYMPAVLQRLVRPTFTASWEHEI
jgi:glycosyltransferase involved in cell wall biosynthesis